MRLPSGSSDIGIIRRPPPLMLLLFLLLACAWPLRGAAGIACLTNSACTGKLASNSRDCLSPKLCPGGCRSRRYTRPSGELLALRLDCARADEAAGVAEFRYCRHLPDCNRAALPWVPSDLDDLDIELDNRRGGRRSCLDWNGQSKSCSPDKLCMTLHNRSAGCQADMLQLFDMVNTSHIARYAVSQVVCRQQSMCTGTAESLTPATPSPSPQMDVNQNGINADTGNDARGSNSGCLQRLLRRQQQESDGDSRQLTDRRSQRVNVSGGAEQTDRDLMQCMRQLLLSSGNHLESSSGVPSGKGGVDAAGSEVAVGGGGSGGGGRGGGGIGKGGTGDDQLGGLLLKALILTVCLLCAALLAVLIRSLLIQRRRLRAARRRRRRQGDELRQLQQQQQHHQQRQQQQQQQHQFMSSPSGSAMTTLTLPHRAVQLLLQLDEELQHQQLIQLQQQQQQQQLQQQQQHPHCCSTVHSSPCATIRPHRAGPRLLQDSNFVHRTAEDFADLEDDTFV